MADFYSLATKVVDADIGKFTIFFLMVFFIVNGRGPKKMQQDLLAFITKNLSDLKESFESAKKDTFERLDKYSEKMDAFKEEIRTKVQLSSDEMLKTRTEYLKDIHEHWQKVEELKKAVEQYGEENAMVVKLMAEERQMMDGIKENYSKFLLILKDKVDQRNGL